MEGNVYNRSQVELSRKIILGRKYFLVQVAATFLFHSTPRSLILITDQGSIIDQQIAHRTVLASF